MPSVRPTPAEKQQQLPGDFLLAGSVAVIDRAFSVPGTPEIVWPWFLQLGKNRAGWYLPHSVERFVKKEKRAIRVIDPQFQHIEVGGRIDDWGGKKGYLEVVSFEPGQNILYTSTRGHLSMTWVITVWPEKNSTRVLIRLRIKSSPQSKLFLHSIGALFDKLTIIGLAAGLTERLNETNPNRV